MFKRVGWLALCLFLCSFCKRAYSQQDVDFHLSAHLLSGKKIIKVKRDYYDPYLWVLTQNDEVYRINSLTLAIDDYTAAFSAYNNLQFTDIAGRSQDTVFIGTNSNALLEYQKGVVKNIGPANNITGSINQIGIDFRFKSTYYTSGSAYAGHCVLEIATTNNLYTYDDDTQIITVAEGSAGNNQLFEASYRSEVYSYFYLNGYYGSNDTTQSYSVLFQSRYTSFEGNIWYGNPIYGYHINTAYNIKSIFNDPSESNMGYDEVDFMNELWGTENGLMQTEWDYSYFFSTSVYKHYLNGIKVNKITSIYGLVNFPNLLKENVLIGTDKGLYFTNSGYGKYVNGRLNDYNTFTLDADIGNQHINDVCVNAVSYTEAPNTDPVAYTATVCEDAVWIAADNGLYLIKPDYTPYLSSNQIKAINFRNQPDTLSTLNLCAGSAAVATINSNAYAGNNVQWYKNGAEISLAIADTLAITQAGDYNAVIYDACANVHMETNHLKVNIISGPVFTFNYPDEIEQCNSNPDTLNVTYSPAYHYRWYTNAVLNGDTTSSLIVNSSGKYYVEVSACTNSWVLSKAVTVNVVNLPVPSITSNKNIYCQSDTALLSANTIADPSYTIHWYKDNVLLTADENQPIIKTTVAGSYVATITSNSNTCSQSSAAFQLNFTPSPVFTFSYPATLNYCAGSAAVLKVQGSPAYQYRWYSNNTLNGVVTDSLAVTKTGSYKVEVSACEGSWVPSQAVQVNFSQQVSPVITPDKPAYCLGDQATLNLNIPADPSYIITWFRDGAEIGSYQNLVSVTTSIPGHYTVAVNSIVVPNCVQTSAPVPIVFNPIPTVSIQQNTETALCVGQSATLKAIYSSGSVKWSTGETSNQITVSTAGTYKVTLTSPAGCMADTSITLSFLPDPVLNVKDTTICSYKNQSVILMAPAGFSQYIWNNQPGVQTYMVTLPQTVNLTVTDLNGCQASQQIHVTEQCPEVEIPNTFTPNGDGINDTWIIEGINSDPTVSLKVFNRYGALVFKSNGYSTPWNGQYNGTKVPSGVYYYILTTKKGKQIFSGPVTILY